MKFTRITKIKFISAFFASVSVFLFFSCSKPGDMTVQRAMKAYQNQNYEEALNLFLEAKDESSNYSDELIYTFIANLYAVQEDIENSTVYQEKALELKPDYRGLVTLGMNYHMLEKDDEAEETYKKAVKLMPEKGEAYASLGSLYIGQKKYSEAVENLKKAAEYEPKIAVIHANLAVALSLSGNKNAAEEEFKKAEELKCENLDEFKIRAEILN